MAAYQKEIDDILTNRNRYHTVYYDVKTFGGPSLYFHRRALEIAAADFDRCLEYIYAVLTSWGMHRMGSGGSKMQPFDVFQRSVVALRGKIERARTIRYENVTEADWALLKPVFAGVNVMVSETRLVGNSKVMAHLLPNITVPIDREYTLKFLKGNGTISNGLDREWSVMRGILEHFFIPIARDAAFGRQAQAWMADQNRYPWDTSVLKVIDNLVVGAMKVRPKKARGKSEEE